LVQYNSMVHTEQKLIAMEKASVKELEDQITRLTAGGGTDLCGGLVQGVKIAAGSTSNNKVSAVLLLTDGHATTVKSPQAIVSKCRKALGNKACSIFCFGFGSDHDAQLLKKIADDGAGSYFFIEKEADIDSYFADCLGGLISVACQKMVLTIEPLSGVTIKKVLGSKPPKSIGAAATSATHPDTPHPRKKKISSSESSEEDEIKTITSPEDPLLNLEDKKNTSSKKRFPEKKLRNIYIWAISTAKKPGMSFSISSFRYIRNPLRNLRLRIFRSIIIMLLRNDMIGFPFRVS